MRITDFRSTLKEMIAAGEESQRNWTEGINEYRKKEIQILCEDIESTCQFIRNDCTAEELSWISEIWDEVAKITQSHNFIHALKYAIEKFPKENEIYHLSDNFQFSINEILDDDSEQPELHL